MAATKRAFSNRYLSWALEILRPKHDSIRLRRSGFGIGPEKRYEEVKAAEARTKRDPSINSTILEARIRLLLPTELNKAVEEITWCF